MSCCILLLATCPIANRQLLIDPTKSNMSSLIIPKMIPTISGEGSCQLRSEREWKDSSADTML